MRSGLEVARSTWQAHAQTLLAPFPRHRGRIAVGLVGHGSECFGFDDALSRDHDVVPGFCLWLTAADHAEIGAELAERYAALPDVGRGAGVLTARASGAGRRTGVFEIGSFYDGLTGYREAPPADHPHAWLLLEEATLATVTNGAVFADPHGAFGAVRAGFTRMPRDVRLALVSRRLGTIAQAGQVNLPRMLARGDADAAWLALAETARAVASLVFLLNGPASAGYLPFYKWQPAALRRLSARPGARLPGVCAELSALLRAGSAACFGGESPGPGAGRGAVPGSRSDAAAQAGGIVEEICRQVVGELRAQGLSVGTDLFLERHRAAVGAQIEDGWVRSL